MSPNEIVSSLRRRPFVPIRIHVAEQATYDIHLPEMVMVGTTVLFIGLRRDVESPYFDEPVLVVLRHITRVEPIIEAQTAS